MDMTPAAWRKSSHSGSNGGTCVEVGTTGPAASFFIGSTANRSIS
jgi:Domain of unknown function (DUF397)